MDIFTPTLFLVAQMTPLFTIGPFQVSRSIDPGTLAGAIVIVFGLVRILRKLEKRWDSVNSVLFGEMDPDGRTIIRLGLVERVKLIEEDCPVWHQHRRKEDDQTFGHRRKDSE